MGALNASVLDNVPGSCRQQPIWHNPFFLQSGCWIWIPTEV